MKQNYQAYYKTNVQTSDQLTLIIMLYEGAIRFGRKAIHKIEVREIEAAHHYLVRTRDILSELLSTLHVEQGGQVAENLKQLYLYMFNRIVAANLTKDPAIIQEVIGLLETLKQGWGNLRQQNQQKVLEEKDNTKKVSIQG